MTRLTVAILGVAVFAFASAWQLQATAAHDLRAAAVVQAREVNEPEASGPSPEENRAIIAALERATEVRRAIEADLKRIEAVVAEFSARQRQAHATARRARVQLGRIGGALAAAAHGSKLSARRLDMLQARLALSVRLARAIARELAELDRSMGP